MACSKKSANQERRRAQRREYYQKNMEEERRRARERAKIQLRSKREQETAAQAKIRKARHRANQARYREQNRLVLKVKSWQDRCDKKWRDARNRDELEYQVWMAEDGGLKDLGLDT